MAALFAMIHDAPPVPQSRPRVTRWGTFYGKRATEHRKALAGEMKAAYVGAPLAGPLAVRIAVAGARASSDLDNHLKMVLDALQDAGVLASDDIRAVAVLEARAIDGEPRTIISVETL